jgi:hypothetical protein
MRSSGPTTSTKTDRGVGRLGRGTSAYYVAMRDTTPYASFLPLNGYIMILATLAEPA